MNNQADQAAHRRIELGTHDPATTDSATTATDWVEISRQTADRAAFLKRVAIELRARFSASIVAVEDHESPQPLMLVVDESLAAIIDRDAIRHGLRSLGSLPVSSELATTLGPTRSIGVELAGSPQRAAILIVFPLQSRLEPLAQVECLKELRNESLAISPVLSSLAGVAPSTSAESLAPTGTRIAPGALSCLHQDLDWKATTFRIASESRRLLQCDRVTVLTTEQKKVRVAAVSGVSVVDRRSNAVRAAEQLCSAARVLARPVVLPGDEDLPPQITDPLDRYLDESGVLAVVLLPLAIQPSSFGTEGNDELAGNPTKVRTIERETLQLLRRNDECSGMMMLEYFSGEVPDEISDAMQLVRYDATLALRNAMEHRVIWGLPFWKAIGRLVRSRKRWMWLLIALATIGSIAAGCLIPIPHYIIATGSLEPSQRKNVYATIDGTVKEILVENGALVRAGDVLLTLENADLENQAEVLAGEIQTASQRLASTRAIRLSTRDDSIRESQLAMEQRQLESELASLRTQANLVATMQEELTVRSPIKGKIVAWQVERRLAHRPISRGSLLMSVIDEASPWQLRLEIADEDAGTVLNSLDQQRELPIRFVVASEPEKTFEAILSDVATASRLSESGAQIVDAVAPLLTASVESFSDQTRVGASVTAKIRCGERAALASWFSDVIDFVHRNVLFFVR